MTGQSIFRMILPAMLATLLAACVPVDETVPRQHVLEWSEQRLLFVADERASRVQSFHLNGGAPVAYAQTRQNQHSRVRDMQLDVRHGTLWVLGYNGISVYDAHSLSLQRHIPLDGAHVTALRVERDRVVLLADSNLAVGEIDSRGRLFG